MTYTATPDGKRIVGSDVQQHTDGLTGQRPEVHTMVATSSAQYALTVQSQEATNGYIFRAINSAGTALFWVDKDGWHGTSGESSNDIDVTATAYGAAGDVKSFQTGGVANATSTIVSLIGGWTGFTSSDVGKVIAIQGAGVGNGIHVTTVSQYDTATQVRITAAAASTVSGGKILVGTNSTDAFRAAWTAADVVGCNIVVPPGTYFVGNGNWTDAAGITIRGSRGINIGGGVPEFIAATHRGTHILPLPGMTGTWIDWSGNTGCGMEDLVFGRSDQTDWLGATSVNIGLLILNKNGKESTDNQLHNVYFTGTYVTSTVYAVGNNICTVKDSKFYNYATASRVFVLNGRNTTVTSPNLGASTSSINSWNETSRWFFDGAQFHAVFGSQLSPSSTPALYLNNAYDHAFDGCDFSTTYFHVQIAETDTTSTQRLTNTISFRNCNFDNPNPDGGTLYASGACVVSANVTVSNIVMDNCMFRYADNTSTTAQNLGGTAISALVCDFQSATAGALNRFVLRNPNIRNGGYAVRFNASNVTAVRLAYCTIDAAGKPIQSNGKIDEATVLMNPGAITTGSGSNLAAYSLTSGTPPRFYGGAIFQAPIRDSSNNVILDFLEVSSAAQYIQVVNSASGGTPEVRAVGSANDINLGLRGKGSGGVTVQTGPLTILAGNLVLGSTQTISFTNTNATGASAGAATLPANPVAFLVVTIDGTSRRIPFYAS